MTESAGFKVAIDCSLTTPGTIFVSMFFPLRVAVATCPAPIRLLKTTHQMRPGPLFAIGPAITSIKTFVDHFNR
ncbi:hypothetical protein SMB34_05425 [Thalassospira permensis NBRC 106175]|uniref:Uncharacterized protein n=1 Tax=Thalassospira permensis NBRC 106175 TaxID=1353532 RepID=A0ABR4TMI2_9PROT|nr:hypothetical protein SMB34_05425 [Thalassospira permensis NBRC 106175]